MGYAERAGLTRRQLEGSSWRLELEYDGDTHRHGLAADDRRQNRFVNASYRLLRFTATDVLRTPNEVVAQVRAALAS